MKTVMADHIVWEHNRSTTQWFEMDQWAKPNFPDGTLTFFRSVIRSKSKDREKIKGNS